MTNEADEIQAKVAGTFLGGLRPRRAKPARAKPHRCIGCGKVTRHVKCHECMGSTTACSFCGWTP